MSKMYYDLIKSLASLDRCHCGPEMDESYRQLVDFYPSSRLLRYGNKREVSKWLRPPYWTCKKAELIDQHGNIIASRDANKLAVFSYSPPVDKVVTLDELQGHLFSDPNRPDATCFHFRNQYRHWQPEWGFSIPHNVRQNLSDSILYHARIESSFDPDRAMIQSDYSHKGRNDDTYLFVGHFDHPAQVNDGLAGCIAAYEIIRRLQGRQTRFSYRALASVEIVGSVYYLHGLREKAKQIQESLFLGFSGIDSPLVYQQSFHRNSLIDRIIKHLLRFSVKDSHFIYNHRELIGNDENVFDSIGYEIPSGTLLRWPFPQYHTVFDSIEITHSERIEEVVELGLRVVNVIENNYYLRANYFGLPSLANPELNLYLSPNMISGTDISASHDFKQFQCDMQVDEIEYLKNNSHLLNQFMQNMVRLSDGRHTILELSEISGMPFSFTLKYASLMKERGLIDFAETET